MRRMILQINQVKTMKPGNVIYPGSFGRGVGKSKSSAGFRYFLPDLFFPVKQQLTEKSLLCFYPGLAQKR